MNSIAESKCVPARSFAVIFQRNMPNLVHLGITMHDEEFFEAATEGNYIPIDFEKKSLDVSGKQFRFELGQMEKELHDHGGISFAFHVFEKSLFQAMTIPSHGEIQTLWKQSKRGPKENLLLGSKPDLQW